MSSFLTSASAFKLLFKLAKKYAKQWAMKEARVRGEWLGAWAMEVDASEEAAAQAGYNPATPCKLVVAGDTDPRRFRHESGWEYMADTPIITDGGSTPVLARKACKKWADLSPFGRFKDAFYFHDAAYRSRGCWVRMPREAANEHGIDVPLGSELSVWTWMPLTRGMADTLLFQMMPSLGGRNGEINAIFRAVRVGGGRAWRAGNLVEVPGAFTSAGEKYRIRE